MDRVDEAASRIRNGSDCRSPCEYWRLRVCKCSEFAETTAVVVADRTNQQRPTPTVRGIQRDTVEIISVGERFRAVSVDELDVLMHKPLKK
jgi:hypothetical protein